MESVFKLIRATVGSFIQVMYFFLSGILGEDVVYSGNELETVDLVRTVRSDQLQRQ